MSALEGGAGDSDSSSSVPKLGTTGPAVLVCWVTGLLHRYSSMDLQSSVGVSEILDMVILAALLHGWVGAGASCGVHLTARIVLGMIQGVSPGNDAASLALP